MKTSEATPRQLHWLAAKCEGHVDDETIIRRLDPDDEGWFIAYSTDWAQGGPIIERERIELEHDGHAWWARIKADEDYTGPTPLIAAMRCYVASKLGDEVDVPEGLK